MPTPRVSVLLPVRDAAATLASSLASVARQSEAHFECIVVDDGSRDASAAIARGVCARDARFRLIETPPRGLVPALQRGLAACRAPAIARMDADDCMHRERLAAQLGALEGDSRLAGVGCHVRLFPRRALGEGMRAYETWLNSVRSAADVRREAWVECPLAHPGLMLRSRVLRDAGYRDAGWPEDYDLLLRLLGAGHAVGVVPRRLLAWRHGPARLSQRSALYTAARFTACKAHYLSRAFLARHERYLLWGYGATGRALVSALRRHGRRPAAIVEVHPGRLGQRIQGAPVVSSHCLGPPGVLPLLVSVAGTEARVQIRGELSRLGWREGADYCCAA